MTFFFQIFSLTVRAAKRICVQKKSSNLAYSLVLALMLLVMGVGSVSGATYYSRRNGNWDTNTTWSLTSGGSSVGTGIYPGAGDNVVIENYTVSLNLSQGNCNNFTLSSGKFILNKDNINTSLTVNGNYSQTGGIFDFDDATGSSYYKGTLYIVGNFSNTVNTTANMTVSGMSRYSEYNGSIVFNGTTTQTVSFVNVNAARWVDYTINATSSVQLNSNFALYDTGTSRNGSEIFTVNGVLDVGTYTISDGSGVSGGTAFTLNSGATLITANAGGIDGSISATNLTRTFDAGANLTVQQHRLLVFH